MFLGKLLHITSTLRVQIAELSEDQDNLINMISDLCPSSSPIRTSQLKHFLGAAASTASFP